MILPKRKSNAPKVLLSLLFAETSQLREQTTFQALRRLTLLGAFLSGVGFPTRLSVALREKESIAEAEAGAGESASALFLPQSPQQHQILAGDASKNP